MNLLHLKKCILIVLIISITLCTPTRLVYGQNNRSGSAATVVVDIVVRNPQAHSPSCANAFSSLITTLNEVLVDTTVRIADTAITTNTDWTWVLECQSTAESPAQIMLKHPVSSETKFTFNYSEKSEAIEATDLLIFQRYVAGYKPETNSDILTLQDLKPNGGPVPFPQEEPTNIPVYKKWWFWGIVAGGVATSIALALNHNNGHSGARVMSH